MKGEDFQPESWIVWVFRENAAFLLKIFLFVLGFAVLMAGEYLLVSHHYHHLAASGRANAMPGPYDAQGNGTAPYAGGSVQPQTNSVPYLLRSAFLLLRQHNLDSALDQVNLVLQADPRNPQAYEMRGDIYAEKKIWDEAFKNYQMVRQLDGKNLHVQFNLAEILFMRKKYDAARPGFAALEHDIEMGDISAYKVFLCDLFGGHEAAATKELDAFNQVGANASYYFGNAAWSLYHHQTEEARGWLNSAVYIYSPAKVRLYALSLTELGYLPLPAPRQS